VEVAGAAWLADAKASGLERSTLVQYDQHFTLHIDPFLGGIKLADITAPVVKEFQKRLQKEGRSPSMIRKVLVSLGGIFANAIESGQAMKNPVRELRRLRRKKEGKSEARQKRKLKIGVDIPTPEELGAILHHCPPRWRAFLHTAAFTGMRASELRGLRWQDVTVKQGHGGEIHVTQRADRYKNFGAPKSEAGERRVPFGQHVANTLGAWHRELWQMKATYAEKNGRAWEGDLVFPVDGGGVGNHANIIRASLKPACIAAGIVDKNGKPKYTGLHVLRHFYASWLIYRGKPAKVVQERLGHSSITVTFDTYGHLFPNIDDVDEISAAENAIMRNKRA
jgi:integrase